jgi:hypothetical protein
MQRYLLMRQSNLHKRQMTLSLIWPTPAYVLWATALKVHYYRDGTVNINRCSFRADYLCIQHYL